MKYLEADAKISKNGLYRWYLTRTWDRGKSRCLWIMLNPSTADGTKDDPTIRRCVDFSARWGCGGLVVVNLFSYRATDPKFLTCHNSSTVIGKWTDKMILGWADECELRVAAWGAHGQLYRRSTQVARGLLRGVEVWCLGRTASGEPKHPLYVPANTELVPYP